MKGITKPSVSVVIPVLNEANQVEQILKKIETHQTGLVREIIISDGGSTDKTVGIASSIGAKVIHSEKGRARQMNKGAKTATGEIIYFLHADSIPPDEFDREISKAVESGADFGCFRLQFDWNHPLLKFYSWFTRFRFLGVRFGDQSLFVKKTIFEKAGGFDEQLIVMEDQEIYKRLHKHGKFYLSYRSIITSSRKYRKVGVIKLQLIFTGIWLGYYFGADQNTLVGLYKKWISP